MNAYIFKAALYCEDCAEEIIGKLTAEDFEKEGSNSFPQGPFANGGGEADCPQHCDGCGLFLENPLTSEGEFYVKEEATKPILKEWIKSYSYLFAV